MIWNEVMIKENKVKVGSLVLWFKFYFDWVNK